MTDSKIKRIKKFIIGLDIYSPKLKAARECCQDWMAFFYFGIPIGITLGVVVNLLVISHFIAHFDKAVDTSGTPIAVCVITHVILITLSIFGGFVNWNCGTAYHKLALEEAIFAAYKKELTDANFVITDARFEAMRQRVVSTLKYASDYYNCRLFEQVDLVFKPL